MRKLLLLLMFFCTYGLTFAQQKVSGKVTSESEGESLPGVNVIVSGTTNGTTTDIDGNYSLSVPDGNAALVFSFIGYQTQEVQVGNRSTVNISMVDDITQLEEVVVTGYGSVRKADMTSAYTTVGADDIQKTVNTSLEQALQGRAAGVYVTQNTGQPGGAISVNIRGISTLNGNSEPLYVIDGVQVQGNRVSYGAANSANPLSSLNPSDIESMTVLQGPNATALYGSRATNGVIVITTKRGKSGEVRVNYGYQYSLQTPPENLEVMNLRQYAQMNKEYHDIEGGTTPDEFLDPSLLGEGTDWQDELFSSAAMQKHSLSLSGGSDNTTYYLSGEYFNQDGIAVGSGYDRYSLRLNLDNKAKDWLTIGANFNFSQQETKLGTNDDEIIQKALQLSPQVPVKNFDGTWGGGDDSNGANQFTPVNPIALANLNTNEETRRQLLAGLKLGVNITKDLEFRTSFNTNLSFTSSTIFRPSYDFGFQTRPNTRLDERSGTNTYWNWNQTLQYIKQIDKHNINIIVSHEAQESTWKNISAGREGFVVNDIIDLNIGDASTADNGGGHGPWAMESYLSRVGYSYDNRYIFSGAFRADGSAYFGSENQWAYFPSLSAAWGVSEEAFFDVPFINDLKLRYEIGLTGNQGGGSGIYGTLGAGATQWGTGFLPSVYPNPGVKWEETKTNNVGINLGMFENRIQIEADYYVKQTSNLLLRNPLPRYMATSGQGAIQSPLVNIGGLENKGWTFAINTVNIDNGDFKWESNFNISHFKTKITEFYSDAALLDRVTNSLDGQSGVAWTQRSVVGETPWQFYGYIQEGIFQSVDELENSALVAVDGEELPISPDGVWVGDVKYKDVNGDGIITIEDQTFMGNPYPKFHAGFTNSFSYKGFDLSIIVTATYGNDVYNFVAFKNTNPNNINLSRNLLVEAFDYAKVAYPEGDVNEENPYLLNPGTQIARIDPTSLNENFVRHTSKYVEDGSFIRLKNISLNYNFPQSLISKQGVIKGARIGVSAQNVATITGYSGYDPEIGGYVGANVDPTTQPYGVDNGRYPLTPIYSVNVGIDF